jgi:hypothetical protein
MHDLDRLIRAYNDLDGPAGLTLADLDKLPHSRNVEDRRDEGWFSRFLSRFAGPDRKAVIDWMNRREPASDLAREAGIDDLRNLPRGR